MSVWTRLRTLIAALPGGAALIDLLAPNTPAERSEGFAMAVVALGAKMAKADGIVTRDEVIAFREVFQIDDEDLPHVGQFYDLARKDTAGFDLYAARIARMFEGREDVLETLLDGLFHIAQADGVVKDIEVEFLREIARIFGLDSQLFDRVHLRNLPGEISPYDLLGVPENASLDEIHRIWRKLAARHHPDRLRGEGVPLEATRLAERRLAEINAAYGQIRKSLLASPAAMPEPG